MYDDFGRVVKEAGPSMPVVISGLDEVPNADDHFHVVTQLAKAREIADRPRIGLWKRLSRSAARSSWTIIAEAGKPKITELKIVLKAEARGSIEAISKELEKLVHEEVRVRFIARRHRGNHRERRELALPRRRFPGGRLQCRARRQRPQAGR